jgi:hypothetical protein
MAQRFSSLRLPRADWRRRLLIAAPVLIAAVVLAALLRLWVAPAAPAADAELAPYLAAIEREPHVIDGYRNLSRLHAAAGRFEEAIAVWERAAQANPGQTWPLLELGAAYADAGRLLQAREAVYRAASLNPQDTAANQALARLADEVANQQAVKNFLTARLPGDDPEQLARGLHFIRQPAGNGWTFLGYYGDAGAAAHGQRTPLWTFWQSPLADMEPTIAVDNWENVAPGVWGRQVTAVNLVGNGDFEGGIARGGPEGFPTDFFAADLVTRQLRRVLRGDDFTTAALLANDARNRNTSFVSSQLAFAADNVLLTSVDVKNEGGNPSLSWSWPGARRPAGWTQPPAVTESGTPNDWQTYAGLAVPPPAATTMQVELRNIGSSGAVYYDNVVSVALPAPAPLWQQAAGNVITPEEAAGAAQAVTEDWNTRRFQEQIDRYRAFPAAAQSAEWQAALGEIGPLVRVDQALRNGWVLLGYSTDESALARGEPTPLALYWQGPAGSVPGTAEDGWMALPGGAWLQFLPHAANSLHDGTFESGLAAWPERVFPAPAASRQLAVMERGGFTTTVAALANTAAFTATSLASAWQPAASDRIYLQTGWMHGLNGRGWIGYQWAGGTDPSLAPNAYIVAADEASEWQHYAGVAEPAPGAQDVQVHLLNYPASGIAYFDDIVFVSIPAPAATSAPANAAQSNARLLPAEYAATPEVVEDEGWLTAVAAAGPARLLDQGLDNGWSFIGYSADEEALAAGAMTPVFYFWQGPPGATPGTAQEGWYSIDAGLWLQIDQASNLLAGGQLLTLPANPATETVPVDERLLYLQAARARSLNGAATQVGVRWHTGAPGNAGEATGDSAVTQYVAIHLKHPDWTPVGGLLAAPAGASGAQVLLAGADGATAEADELLLLPVTPPALR